MNRFSMGAADRYKETSIKTASPAHLIAMLYDKAISEIFTAEIELDKEKPSVELVNNSVLKAQRVVEELEASLDVEAGGEVAKNLLSLYIYFNEQLAQANIDKDKAPLTEVRSLLKELAEAWHQIDG